MLRALVGPLAAIPGRLCGAIWIVACAIAWGMSHASILLGARTAATTALASTAVAYALLATRFRRHVPPRLLAATPLLCAPILLLGILVARDLGILRTLVPVLGLVLVWLLVTTSLGGLALAKRPEPRSCAELAFVCVCGHGIVLAIGLVLAATATLRGAAVLTVLGVPAFLFGVGTRGRAFWRGIAGLRVALPTDRLGLVIFVTLATSLAAVVVDGLAPLPRGWDGLTQYVLVAREIAERGALVRSPLGTGYELVVAQVLAVGAGMPFALQLFGAVPALLTVILVHGTLERHQGRSAALLGTLVLATLPLWTFQATEESKVDLAALMFFAAAWFAVEDAGLAPVCGTLLALATAVKATLGLAAVAFLLAEFRTTLRIGVAAALAFLPFAIVHGLESGSLAPRALLVGGTPMPPIDWSGPGVPPGLAPAAPEIPGAELELRRYGHALDPGAMDLLLWPVRATLQTAGVRGAHVDPGFAPLALLPFVLVAAWNWLRHERTRRTRTARVLVFALVFWTLWSLFGRQILWYALPGFLVFAHTAAALPSRVAATLLASLLVGFAFAERATTFGKALLLRWASGALDASACEGEALPLAGLVGPRLRAEPDAKVLLAGTPYAWVVPRAFERGLLDPTFDLLARLAKERDPTLLRERLRWLGVRYVLFDRNVPPGYPLADFADQKRAIECVLAQVTERLGECARSGHAFYRVP